MKRFWVLAAVLILGVGLFWWGQRSRMNSAVMTPLDETNQEAASETPEVNATESSATQQVPEAKPENSPTAPTVAEEMKARDLKVDQIKAAKNLTMTPTAERLVKTSLVADSKWKVWTGVKAVPATKYQGDPSQVIGKMAGFVFLSDSSMNGDDRTFTASKPLVVFDDRMGRAGIVTGTLKITIRENATIDEVAAEYGLKVVNSFENLRLYFVAAVNEPVDLGGLLAALKKDHRISQADLEIVSRNYEKN